MKKPVHTALQGADPVVSCHEPGGAGIALVLAPDGLIREVSPSVSPVLGYAPEAVRGTLFFRHVHDRDVLAVFKGIADLALGLEQETDLEFHMRAEGGRWTAFRARACSQFEGPVLVGILLTLQPVLTALLA